MPYVLQVVAELSQRHQELSQRHQELSQRHQELSQRHQELSQRQLTFEAEQLPALLHTLSDVNSHLVESDKKINHLMSSVPVALRKMTRDQIALNKQLVNLSESAKYLFGRVEFVRRELMFEMRYSASDPLAGEVQLTAKSEIVSPEKLAVARKNKLLLNLGCGHIPLEGYLNVDRRALPGVDIVAEVDDLPLETGEVDKIFSAHLLEHFPQEQLRRELLPYYFNLLKAGGEFRAIVPDAEAMIREYSTGNYPYDDMREVLFGGQDYDGDFHFNMFSPKSMTRLLEEAGFVKISIIEAGRKNGRCFEFEIVAMKFGDKDV
jgi:predicted SAM-dependent methyltransferase/FtsZ-binding cell division protein ZapB